MKEYETKLQEKDDEITAGNNAANDKAYSIQEEAAEGSLNLKKSELENELHNEKDMNRTAHLASYVKHIKDKT